MVAMKGNTEVRYTEHAWGACFTGTKKALIQAGLIDEKHTPRKGREITYRLPLNWGDGYNAACFGPTYGAIPPRWDARAISSRDEGVIDVHVKYEWEELDVRPRIAHALKALDELRAHIEAIAPRPIAESLREWIARSASFPSEAERRTMDAELEDERRGKIFAVDRKPAKGSRKAKPSGGANA